MKSGIYFSANDYVYNWTLGFLRSLRQYNPDILVYWIPFNEEVDKIASIANQYQFKTYIDDSFDQLEKLGSDYELGFSPNGKYWFRRYAAFWGPLDEFFYLDARQLILDDITPLFKPLKDQKLDFLYYDLALNQVYEPGDVRQEFLRQKQARGFNSGRWASRKGVFTLDEMLDYGYESIQYRNQMNPRNTDQAFINYCVDKKPALKTAHISEWFGDYIHQGWAGQSGKVYKKQNHFYLWDYGGLDHKKKLLLLHWAGFQWEDNLPHGKLLNYYSRPSITTLLKRTINGIKKRIKSWWWLRKLMKDI